jgi:hypothetical protein
LSIQNQIKPLHTDEPVSWSFERFLTSIEIRKQKEKEKKEKSSDISLTQANGLTYTRHTPDQMRFLIKKRI